MTVVEIKARAADRRERDARIKAVLQSPDADFIRMAMQLVSLDDMERAAVELCLRRGMSQEQAAEALDCSTEAIQKWSRSARDKLWAVWSGRWWMRKIMDL